MTTCAQKGMSLNGLTCTECGKQGYVGKTGQQLEERVNASMKHRLSWDKPVAVHSTQTHSIHNVQVSVLEKVHGQSKALCLVWKVNG